MTSFPPEDSVLTWSPKRTRARGASGREYVFYPNGDHWHVSLYDVDGNLLARPLFSCRNLPTHAQCVQWAEETERSYLSERPSPVYQREPKPTVGRIVHYRSFGTPNAEYTPECRAAIVTEVITEDDQGEPLINVVSLAVINPTGTFFNSPVFHDPAAERGGSWHWPCDIQPPAR